VALLKVLRHVRHYGIRSTVRKMLAVVPAYVSNIHLWRVRRCGCCERVSIFLCNGASSEFRCCLYCSANERYELLAAEIKTRYGKKLAEKDVLELDSYSPLKNILAVGRSHTRSFYDSATTPGSVRNDGAICQDITSLTFEDASFDLIVSSDVLEHVPRLDLAFTETARVLRPGGAHLFTVPPRRSTRARAKLVDGKIHDLLPAEYHLDPLNPKGILAFWDVGPDLPRMFSAPLLDISIVRGPAGNEGRVVWMAERKQLARKSRDSSGSLLRSKP
jgi:SAM-dependent methyltransferase